MMRKILPSAWRLRELFEYDSATGHVTRRIASGRAKKGASAVIGGVRGYKQISVDGRLCLVHRVVWCWMTGAWPKSQIDHINRDRGDNRWENLREATHAQNKANSTKARNSKSGLKGAYRQTRNPDRWHSCITVGGKTRYIGVYATAEDAHRAYCAKAREVFGEFASA